MSSPYSPTQPLALIPRPLQVHFTGEQVLLPPIGRICYRGPEHSPIQSTGAFLAQELLEDIHTYTGFSWQWAQGDLWQATILLQLEQDMQAQSYRLEITQDQPGITVLGADLEGLRYGVQTLRQILAQRGALLPTVSIYDKPCFPVRSYSLDVTRGRVPTMDWLQAWARKLSFYKYNQLQLYIEHAFAFDGLSESWRGTSPLQPQDIIEFDSYCKNLGIELVPSLSTFSHHYMTLRTASLKALGEFPEDAGRPYSFIERQEHHTLNVADPQSFEFSCSLIDAYAQLFSTRKFNIGGDETFDLGKGQSRALAQKVGVDTLYSDYLIKLCDHLSEQGLQPMFWGDIAVSMPQVLNRLPKENPLLNWLYSPQVDDTKVKLVAQRGLPQYVCSAVHAWNTLLPHIHDAWSNISRLNAYGKEYGAVGAMVTDWGDYGSINDPVMSIPGLLYAAQYSWNPDGADFEQLNQDISRLEYADKTGTYMQAFTTASQSATFSWQDMVMYMELDDGQGGVNQDVNKVIAQFKGADNWQAEAMTSLAAARKHYLSLCADKLERTHEAKGQLDQAAQQMAACLAGGASDPTMTSQAQFLAMEGQKLFNELGSVLADQQGLLVSGKPHSLASAQALAGHIEVWFEAYRDRWLQVSHESELRRVSRVIWAYTDLLRS